MAIKLKPQGPRCKRFEFWTKVAKVTKPQGPKWQFTKKEICNYPLVIQPTLLKCGTILLKDLYYKFLFFFFFNVGMSVFCYPFLFHVFI
ncbi:hypothetical protein Hanom_Chr01g00052271 [Helianthus anomalus]